MTSQKTEWKPLLVHCLLLLLGGILGGVLSLILRNSLDSPKFLNITSIFGAGLLLGVGLIVIIPEGISLILNSYPSSS